MATMGAMLGLGLTASFTVNASPVFTAKIRNMDWDGGDVTVLEDFGMELATRFKTYFGGLIDPGNITLECLYDHKATATSISLLGATTLQYQTGTLLITLPDPDAAGASAAGTFSSLAFVTNNPTSVHIGEVASITYNFKLSGAATIVATA